MELRQDSMTVAEYEAKFTKLVRFAPHVIDTDYKKARHFEGGLRSDILERGNVLKLETYIGVLDRAIILEANIARQAKTTTDWKGNKRQGFFSKKKFLKKKNSFSFTSSCCLHFYFTLFATNLHCNYHLTLILCVHACVFLCLFLYFLT